MSEGSGGALLTEEWQIALAMAAIVTAAWGLAVIVRRIVRGKSDEDRT